LTAEQQAKVFRMEDKAARIEQEAAAKEAEEAAKEAAAIKARSEAELKRSQDMLDKFNQEGQEAELRGKLSQLAQQGRKEILTELRQANEDALADKVNRMLRKADQFMAADEAKERLASQKELEKLFDDTLEYVKKAGGKATVQRWLDKYGKAIEEVIASTKNK